MLFASVVTAGRSTMYLHTSSHIQLDKQGSSASYDSVTR